MTLSWPKLIQREMQEPYLTDVLGFIETQLQQGKTIYPPKDSIFAAFDRTPFNQVKVVIIGQDPYHGPGQAHGLCFSVQKGVDTPPSLRNIFQEIRRDFGAQIPGDGDLTRWADQGVLLLNSVLTVEAGQAGSHRNRGWEKLTDRLIQELSTRREHLVFLLWGAYAIAKTDLIDASKHLILTAPHPSPLSAHRGYIGCGHFSQTNAYLAAHGIEPISWVV